MSKKKISATIDRILTIELVRVTERAAVAAARMRGRGDERAADLAAIDAMERELNHLPIDGTIVIGEGAEDAVDHLYIGEKVGTLKGPEVDVAAVALEGATLCAKNLPNALTVVAMATGGSFLNVPDVYMEKIAVGGGLPDGLIDLDATPAENLAALARAKGVAVEDLSVCILDRPRHARLIEEVREAGAAIRLIGDGDVSGVFHTTSPERSGVDIYMGTGGASEGILAAAALRCIGGQMQGRLVPRNKEERDRIKAVGLKDVERKYAIEDMVPADVYFAATGVTDGNLVRGVHFRGDEIRTHSVVMRSSTGTVRWVDACHHRLEKFHLNR
ncbi:class II fructose-bisphosphatase [Rhodobium gokarnense]|uniref:Fructose-1,6-bisphosphatase n=1 Tax=Rhodobium gokarnense TaxID=364296 RepID=A0ABT3HHQ8_9HYPH|nr:class II fructose-bisphosphatase [Rhodobium gokarnense]MCW2309923.1 fructose-1,6-bisphosphatase II / sedoheptulose-1,7-bisphosphatase [Rhodobium gokarnense]